MDAQDRNRASRPANGRPGRPWLAAAGFLLALALTVATVILTGLYVRGPGADTAVETRRAEPLQATRPASPDSEDGGAAR